MPQSSELKTVICEEGTPSRHQSSRLAGKGSPSSSNTMILSSCFLKITSLPRSVLRTRIVALFLDHSGLPPSFSKNRSDAQTQLQKLQHSVAALASGVTQTTRKANPRLGSQLRSLAEWCHLVFSLEHDFEYPAIRHHLSRPSSKPHPRTSPVGPSSLIENVTRLPRHVLILRRTLGNAVPISSTIYLSAARSTNLRSGR